jgi:hypothetical protein
MKKILICTIIVLLFSPFTNGQSNDLIESRKGSLIGAGIGFYNYQTSWFFKYEGEDYIMEYKRPYHGFSRTVIHLEYEYRSLINAGFIHFDLNLNAFYGLAGKTTDDWITDETISDGGVTVGGGVLVKLAVPFEAGSDMLLTPYTSSGFQYIGLESNGEGVSEEVESKYRYDDGWYESIFGIPWMLGIELDIGKYVFSFEYGLLIGGGVSTSWDPAGPDVEKNYEPEMNTILLSVGYCL